MPNCSVCGHPDVKQINELLIRSVSLRDIAKQFGLTYSSIHRHKKNCLPEGLIKARDIQEVANADDLLSQIQDLQEKTLQILNANLKKDDRIALTAIREARSNVELLGRLLGELNNSTLVLAVSPEWVAIRTLILEALKEYPEARQAVLDAINSR